MKQFFSDWIHLTQGEMFIKYWWLWLLFFAGVYFYCAFKVRK